jgi:1,4-alpha-glucan branching enzyme
MTPVVRHDYLIGVPHEGTYIEVLNTDSETYGGSGKGNLGSVTSTSFGMHGMPASVNLTLPPLAAVFLRPGRKE